MNHDEDIPWPSDDEMPFAEAGHNEATIKNLQALVDDWHVLRGHKALLEDEITELNKKIKAVESKMIPIMEAANLKRFDGTRGSITFKKEMYVNLPKGDDKDQFIAFLKDQGLYDTYATFNHMAINSYFKEELKQAMEEGRELRIPGLEPQERTVIGKGR